MSLTRTASPSSLHDHPLAGIVPQMRPGEWTDLYADIALRGIRVPLEVLGDGTVLDGRHRLRAALELGLTAVPITDAPLNGDSPTAYMLRAAVLRRHLTDDQRAAMAALWKAQNKQQGERTDLTSARRGAEVSDDDVSPTRAAAVELFNAKRKRVDRAGYVQERDRGLFDKVHNGDLALNNVYRQVRGKEERQRIADTTPPAGTFQVIVIDPPWPFTIRQSDPKHEIANQYETMTIDQIKAFSLPASAESIVWLWVPNAFLHDAFHILEAWGLTYRTTLTWVKNFPGLGDWLAGQTEHCLLATKGPYKLYRNSESTFLPAPRGKHSEKPDEFYRLIEDLCPGTKIDLFARKERQGWETWGAEAPK